MPTSVKRQGSPQPQRWDDHNDDENLDQDETRRPARWPICAEANIGFFGKSGSAAAADEHQQAENPREPCDARFRNRGNLQVYKAGR